MKKRLIIIDGNSLINRAFYAIPDLTNTEGIHTNGVYGFINMLNKIIDDYRPDYISVAFDMKAPTFRHKEYKEYKAQRKKMPKELAQQMPILKEILDAYKVHRTQLEGFEADDLIGTLAKHCDEMDFEVIVVTGDRDALQLVSDNTKVLITRRGITNLEIYDERKIEEEYGITPNQIIDFKGLVGDKSDNIPGVPGIGEKTASKLLKQFSSVEEILENADKITSTRAKNSINENREIALLSKRLATIETNVPIEMNVDELKLEDPDYESLLELFKKYEFNSLIKKIVPENHSVENYNYDNIELKEIESKNIDDVNGLKNLIKRIKDNGSIAIKIFNQNKNVRTDRILGIGLSMDKTDYYFINTRDNEELIHTMGEVFSDEDIKKYGHGLKKGILALLRYDIELRGVEFDTYIAEYLLDPSKSDYDISKIAIDYMRVNIKSEEELLGKGKKAKNYGELEEEELQEFGKNWCATVLYSMEKQIEKLAELKLLGLFNDIEMPLIKILAHMEYEGFTVDQDVLKELDEEFTQKIEDITNRIYDLAGEEFNINSPKQLGEILFDKLGLPVIKKTKTGYSTNQDVLNKLYNRHDIIPLIIEYRQLVKIKSTYVDSLFNLINPTTGRIHSSFNQTVTVTGRISSTEPNMQNIPVKLEMGRRIRKVFVPSDDEHTLLDADYSQIELRVLAHMSKDDSLIKAFNEDEDIHTLTASQVFNVPLDEVSSLERGRAKAVNFGIVYGISDYGLSENLNITRKEAKKYIDQYFAKYKGVKEYMDNAVKNGKEEGHVTTLFNRIRYIPELKSRNYNVRSFGERTAMNTPIQGSAADIIKIAMVRVFNELKNKNFKSRLILQVHDELILDVYKDELEDIKELLRENMENATTLDVPLKVDMNSGSSWYETK